MAPKKTRVERICEHCSAPFEAHLSQINRGGGRFCSTTCRYAHLQRERSATWKGGRYIDNRGYVVVLVGPKKYALEHRIVMERVLGRPLRDDEDVHHRDKNRQNNDPANLIVLTDTDHSRLHAREFVQWAKKFDRCVECGTTERSHRDHGLCTKCHARLRWHREHS